MLSIGVVGVGSTAINTGLVEEDPRRRSRRPPNNMTREPSATSSEQRLNTMPVHGAAYVSLTPWYGKLAAFSQAFVAFDFYFQAGVSFAQLKSNCPIPRSATTRHPGTSPMQPGGAEHAAARQQPEQRSAAQRRQPSRPLPRWRHPRVPERLHRARPDGPRLRVLRQPVGRGLQREPCRRVPSDDNRFLHHLFFGAGVSIMFPTTVKRTN